MQDHLVQIGIMGHVGRFRTLDFLTYPRGAQVVCRTNRGLELGSVLCPVPTVEDSENDGELLRQTGSEDQLIAERLERFRDRAFHACKKLLLERNIDAVLVDVEHLFDGESVYFYFLGEVDSELETLTSELAQTYEARVRFKKFAETLASGCGPGCGTTASKCGTGGCGSCALAGGCGASKKTGGSHSRA